MAKKQILFKSGEKKDRHSVAAFLHQLADKIDAGEVILKKGAEDVQLEIPAMVKFEIKADDKPGPRRTKRSLEVELEWYPGEADAPVELG